jgi:hypothetical protein
VKVFQGSGCTAVKRFIHLDPHLNRFRNIVRRVLKSVSALELLFMSWTMNEVDYLRVHISLTGQED